MIGKGIYEFEVEGKKIGFKFGMYAAAITEKQSKCSIMELFARIHSGQDVAISLLHYFYGGAVAYTRNESLSLDEVGDQIDAIGLDNAMTVFAKSIATYLPKNNQAPEPEPVKEPGLNPGE